MLQKRIIALVLVLLIPFSGWATPSQKQTSQGVQFPMRYEGGTKAIEKGKEGIVRVNQEKVICFTKDGKTFSIPIADVIQVSYDNAARRVLAEAVGEAWGSPLIVGFPGFIKTKKHFVNILWEEGGTKKEVIFQVGKDDYEPFLAELQRATGKEWKNLSAERKVLAKEIEKEKKNKVAVQLDRQARVGEVDLKPGLYQVVLLERANQKGELCFFPGKDVDPKKLVASALVEITDQASQVSNAQVVYKEEGRVASISEIDLPTKTLRFQ